MVLRTSSNICPLDVHGYHKSHDANLVCLSHELELLERVPELLLA